MATSEPSIGSLNSLASGLSGIPEEEPDEEDTLEVAFSTDVFHDLSKKSSLFRLKLIEEFHLLENISDKSANQGPKFTTRDIHGI
jgi:hypothetical protein